MNDILKVYRHDVGQGRVEFSFNAMTLAAALGIDEPQAADIIARANDAPTILKMAEHDCEVLKVFVNDQTYHRQNQDAAKLRASIRRLLNAGSGGAECVAARNEATHLLEKS